MNKNEYELMHRSIRAGYDAGGNLDDDDRLLEFADLIFDIAHRTLNHAPPILSLEELKTIRDRVKSGERI